MKFTLVSTVLNEIKRLDLTIGDVKAQTLQPSEIIITDAGSKDGTYEKLLQWKNESAVPIIVLREPGCNVASGRNKAIRAASYDLIASMDFGCRFHPEWLYSIINPFNDPLISIVGGATSVEEVELGSSLAAKADFVMSNGYNVSNINPKFFIPSSRSIAYKKEVFENVGGYPEWLTLAGDDMVFGRIALAKGFTLHIVDKPFATWTRHETLKGFVKEAKRYGLGNGEAQIDFKKFKDYLLSLIFRIYFGISVTCYALSAYHDKGLQLIPVIFTTVSIIAFRRYFNYAKKWWRFRSKKFSLSALIYGFYFFEKVNIGYLRGYIRGYYFSDHYKKNQAKLLKSWLDYSLLFYFIIAT